MRIYVATSWKNTFQPETVKALREEGHEVYDFRNPTEGEYGFSWSKCGVSEYEGGPTDMATYARLLESSAAKKGYEFDINALTHCECCVLLLPSGRSASWEFGYAAGLGKKTIVYMPGLEEPELMYMGSVFVSNLPDLIRTCKGKTPIEERTCVKCAHSSLPPDEEITCCHTMAGSFGLYVSRGPIAACGKDRILFQLHPKRWRLPAKGKNR